jgi:hypothetical protein
MNNIETGINLTNMLKTYKRPEDVLMDAISQNIKLLDADQIIEIFGRVLGKLGAKSGSIIDRIGQAMEYIRQRKENRSKLLLTAAKLFATFIGILIPSIATIVNSGTVQAVYDGMKKK